MNNLNIFNHLWCPWRYPSNWIRNIRMFFRSFKWGYQRVTRGYADYDWWNWDMWMTELMAQSLKTMANKTIGYPGNDEFPTYESWIEYLNKIVNLLQYSLSELPNEYEEAWLKILETKKTFEEKFNGKRTPEEEEIINKYLDIEVNNDKSKYEAQLEAINMIKHVWGHLWD